MACNCSKPVSVSDCQILKEFKEDGRMFIYHIFDDKRGLEVAYVPEDKTPNQIAVERKFFNENNMLEWFYISEHPCLYE
ncbi:hypothetical protein CMT45_01025 [Elizabethkingia anophelis]|nr:hypothetical protein [Elizabethkingia anophelis]